MRGRSHLGSILYFGGMLGVFIGERLIGAGTGRWTTALGVLAVLVAVGWRVMRWRAARGDVRAVERTLLGLYGLGALALLFYFLQSDLMASVLGQALDRTSPKLAGVLGALWPALWLASIVPTILVEAAYASVAHAPRLERGRIRDALLSGFGLAGAVAFAVTLNYVGNQRDKKVDFSYFKTARPGESTRKLARTLDQPVEIALFFPPASEVREEVAGYFTDLAAESKMIEVRNYDHAVDPVVAKDLGVSGNGMVVVSRDKRHEQLYVGLEIEAARSQLANLDKEVQKRILQIARPQRNVYLVGGHGERTAEPTSDTDKRSTIRTLRDLFGDQGYQIKNLSAAEGLAADVPPDAAAVVVIGPQKPFLVEEVAALVRYMDRGGRLFLALDPDPGFDWKGLMDPLGLKYEPVQLANDQVFAKRSFQDSDRVNLIASSFSSHPSVTTLGQLAGRAPMVIPGAGYLEELATKPKDVTVSFTVHAFPTTWADKNGNFKFDLDAGEARKAWELAAAVTKKRGEGKPTDEMRAIVLADSDAVSDAVIRAYGNPGFVLDGMKWLLGDEAITGEVTSEADVPIAHTKKQDVVWFYGSTFLAPALALMVGYAATRQRRKRNVKRNPKVGSEGASQSEEAQS